MKNRTKLPSEIETDVITSSRRRCCVCYALHGDEAEKKGQIAHLDQDPSNNALDNLAFLCFDHHDQYDSHTKQSKGLTIKEVKRYRDQLRTFVAKSLPRSDADIVATLTLSLDRPAFRTPFHSESSLPRFRKALTETIETLNTGKTPDGVQLPSKNQIRDASLRLEIDKLVEKIVVLRAIFDGLLRSGEIKHCGCQDPDCPVYMLSDRAANQMDRGRQEILELANELNPDLPRHFYDLP
jgi:hypothetical protein